VKFQQDEPDTSRNVHHETQLTLSKSEDVYITRAATKAKQALKENNPDSSSYSDFTGPQVKQKPSSIEKSLKKTVSKPPLNQPLIPPNIDTFKESTPIQLQEPLEPSRISEEPLKLPIKVEELSKEPDSLTPPIESIPPLERPTFYRPPKKVSKEAKLVVEKRKHNRIMKLAMGMDQYDILSNLDHIQPQISLRQLLALAPRCRSELRSPLVRKRPKLVDVHDISLDPGAPTVDVLIDGPLIEGIQIDSGSSVNLMSVKTMEEIGLTNMSTTPIILRMVDQSRVKPLGILNQVPTTIGGIKYEVNYVIFKVIESISSYPILLGRPSLYLAKAKDDWGKRTLITGKGSNEIVLPMYSTNYQGGTQEEESEFTSGNSYENSESTNLINRDHFKPIGMGEYFQPLTMVDDSDSAILAWQNSLVLNITTEIESEQEPPYETDSEEL
jgi:hypothetical protein